jgi:hypothetical protein
MYLTLKERNPRTGESFFLFEMFALGAFRILLILTAIMISQLHE